MINDIADNIRQNRISTIAVKEDKRKWSHHMWFTYQSPDDDYYYEKDVINYLVELIN